MNRTVFGLLALALAEASGGPEEDAMKLESTSFGPGERIPTRHTCEGQDTSPPLTWSGVPEGTRSLVLAVHDPDAPDPAAPKVDWVHWVLYDLPPSLSGLPESLGPALEVGRAGRNSWGETGYQGPCPPRGEHRYFHELYALDVTLGDLGTPSLEALRAAMDGHVLASAKLMGRYAKEVP